MWRGQRPDSLANKLETSNAELYGNLAGVYSKAKEWFSQSTPAGWTYHGEEHVKEVMRLLDCLIPDKMRQVMNDKEIFLLLASSIWHDYGMRLGPQFRSVHNVISRDSLFDFEQKKAVAEKITLPNPPRVYAKAVARLCYAHRDVQLNGQTIDTLSEIEEKLSFCNTFVHLKTLACLLRLADELDLTQNRFPEDMLQVFDDEHVDYLQQHQLISQVEIDNDLFRIKLHIDEDVIVINPRAKEILQTIRDNLNRKLGTIYMYSRDMAAVEYRLGYRDVEIIEPRGVTISGDPIIEHISHSLKLPKDDAGRALSGLGDEIFTLLRRGKTAEIPNLGIMRAPLKTVKVKAEKKSKGRKVKRKARAVKRRRVIQFVPSAGFSKILE